MLASRERVMALSDIQDTMAESLETCRRLQELISARDVDLNAGIRERQQRFKTMLEERSNRMAAVAQQSAQKGQGDNLAEKKTKSKLKTNETLKKEKEIENTYAEMELFEKKKTQRCEHRQPLADETCCILLEQKLKKAVMDDGKKIILQDMEAFSQKIANEEYLEKIRKQLQQELELRLQRKQNRTKCIEKYIKTFQNVQQEQVEELMVDVLLRRSQFEKKIINELMQIRKEKATLLKNQQIRAEQLAKIRDVEFAAALDEERRQIEIAKHNREDQIRKDWEFHKLLLAKQQEQCYFSHYEMCWEIVCQIIDLSICISVYMELTKNKIPIQLWRTWEVLFIEGKGFFEEAPVNVLYEPLEVNIEEIEREEMRQNCLNEIDFQDYKTHQNVWKIPETCEVENFNFVRSMIGHIVYKILDSVYPFPPPLKVPKYPYAPLRAAILGKPCVGKSAALEKIISKIEEVDPEVQIKTITLQEVVEMAVQAFRDFEDIISPQQSEDYFMYDTENIPSFAPTESGSYSELFKESETYSSPHLEKTSSSELITSETQKDQSQLSAEKDERSEEHEEVEEEGESETVEMSPLAVLGHIVWNCLKSGNEIDDSLIIKIILEIIRSFPSGVILLMDGFPNTYNQAKLLDEYFTGYHTPEDLYKMISETEQKPNIYDLRSSKVIDNPDPPTIPVPPRCIFDVLIYLHAEDKQILEWSSEYTASTSVASDFNQLSIHSKLNCFNKHWTSLGEYYRSRGILHTFEASEEDDEICERIKMLFCDLMKCSTGLESEMETSGELTLTESDSAMFKSKGVQFPSEDKMITEQGEATMLTEHSRETEMNELVKKSESFLPEKEEIHETVEPCCYPACPGDFHWEFVDEYFPMEIASSLAVLWQKMEMRYLSTLKSMFCKLRNYQDCLIRTFHSLQEDFLEFLKRPDDKQECINQWIEEYNMIPEEMRDDDETKAELHKRLNDLQHFLWSISDKHLHEAKHELSDIVNSGWLQEWLGLILNCFVCILQAEVDRFFDTAVILKDYYDGIEGASLKEYDIDASPKIPLIDFHDETTTQLSETTFENVEDEGSQLGDNKSAGSLSFRIPVVECSMRLANLNNEEKQSSTAIQEDIKYSLQQCFNKSYVNAIQGIKEALTTVFQQLSDQDLALAQGLEKKGDKKVRNKSKGNSFPDELTQGLPPEFAIAGVKPLINTKEKIQLERNAAFREEENRALLNLWLIHHNAMQTIQEYEDHAKNVYGSLEYWMKIQYNNEINSIQNASKSIGYAVEEERLIGHEMSLETENIDTQDSILHFIKTEDRISLRTEEPLQPNRFTLKQIENLARQFCFVAPSGFLSSCSFEVLLNDLATKEADLELLPSDWKHISPSQVHKLVNFISSGNGYVNWRSFLLSIAKPWPYPSIMELLNVSDRFSAIDDNQMKLMTENQLEKIELWFHSSVCQEQSPYFIAPFNRLANLKKVLFCIFSSDAEFMDYLNMLMHFAANSDPIKGFIRALSIACGYPVDGSSYSCTVSENFDSTNTKNESEKTTTFKTDEKIQKSLPKKLQRIKPSTCETTSRASVSNLNDIKIENAKPTIVTKENPKAKDLLKKCIIYANRYGMDATYEDLLVNYLQNSVMEFEECLIPFSSVFYVFSCGLHNFEHGGHLCLTDGEKLKENLENIFFQLGSTKLEPVLFSNLIHHPSIKKLIYDMPFFKTLDVYDFFENEILAIGEEM